MGRLVRLVIRVVAPARVAVRRLLWELLGVLRAVGARLVRVGRGVLVVEVAVGGGPSFDRNGSHDGAAVG